MTMKLGKSKWTAMGLVAAAGICGAAYYWYRYRKTNKGEIVEEEFVEMTPHDKAMAAKTDGNKFFKEGNYQSAVTCYTQAIDTCPAEFGSDMAAFYQNRAAAYEQIGDVSKVIEDCSAAVKLNNRYPKALQRRARAHESEGNYSKALEDITATCLLEGFQNQPNLLMADRILKQLGKKCAHEAYSSRKTALPSVFFIRNYLAGFCNDPVFTSASAGKVKPTSQAKELAEATPPAEGEVTKEGETTPVVNGEQEETKPSPYEQAEKMVSESNYRSLIQLCTEELAMPDSANTAKAYLMRGTMYILHGQGEEAIKDFDAILALKDADKRIVANALIKKGSLMIQGDQMDLGVGCFEKAVKIDPDNSDIYHHRGQQLLLVEKLDDAISYFDKAIKLSPNFATSYVQRAYAMHRSAISSQNPMGLMKADSEFKAAMAKFPTCSDVFLLYGQAQCDQGMFTEAGELFSKAEKLEPDNANILVHKGLLSLQTTKDPEQAMAAIRRAVEVDPQCEYAHEIMGTIEVQRGQMQSAEYHFRKAIDLSKSEAEMAHIFSLLNASQIQSRIAQNLGIEVPTMP